MFIVLRLLRIKILMLIIFPPECLICTFHYLNENSVTTCILKYVISEYTVYHGTTITSFIHVHDLINDLTYEIDVFLII